MLQLRRNLKFNFEIQQRQVERKDIAT